MTQIVDFNLGDYMSFGIGIDTGGTYTDAVIYDFSSKKVLAKGKSRTIKENLTGSICAALDHLPIELARQASVVSLSTTLATNACVEGKGGRAKVVLVGTSESVLRRISAPSKYGFPYDDSFCIDVKGAFDGSTICMPDWDAFMDENAAELSQAQAMGIAEIYAERNGAVVEHEGARVLSERFGVPVIIASSLVDGLNMMERGATAVLNARLLPVIKEFLDAASEALVERGITAPVMVMRSDSSLMGQEFARKTPVETMVSGPAASVQGCRELAYEQEALIVDMGGTTSDISLVEHGVPAMTDGIRIGNWRTQVKGVLIDTVGLGGDSVVTFEKGDIGIAETRVEPLCMAVSRWPHLLERLQMLIDEEFLVVRPMYEVLYILREPAPQAVYSKDEMRLLDALRDGPRMLADLEGFEYFELERGKLPARLESEGVIMRCGLTPTDIMHIRGDFSQFDKRASLLAVRYLCRLIPSFGDNEAGWDKLCDYVYNLVKRKLYVNIARVLLEHRHPMLFADGLPQEFEQMLEREWNMFVVARNAAKQGDKPAESLRLNITMNAPILGVGAPIHVFLSDVAEAFGTTCVVPENAEVANAVGAVAATVSARVVVKIAPDWSPGGIVGYVVGFEGERNEYDTLVEAKEAASEVASRAARKLALERGLQEPIDVSIEIVDDESVMSVASYYRGTQVVATATSAQA